MPSDVEVKEKGATGPELDATSLGDRAYAALQGRIDGFRLAVAEAEREVQAELLHRGGGDGLKAEQALVELGPFAMGRIDPDRFGMLLGISEEELTPESMDVLDQADAILVGFAERSSHRVSVEPGGDLRDVVKEGLAQLGRPFGAARAVELARAGVYDPEEHGHLLGPLPFRMWNRAERRLAPPLVVEVRGEDCLPAGLGEFLDGTVTIVLVASGPTTPAPLARLVTPGTFVMQTSEVDDLAKVAATEHAAVVLLFDADRPEQACFVHDPDTGDAPWSRITVSRMPADATVGRGRRAPVWLEELMHLKALAAAPVAAGSEGGVGSAEGSAESPTGAGGVRGAVAGVVADPADRLAAWLLAHTDVSDL
jgi:hypothetical protein